MDFFFVVRYEYFILIYVVIMYDIKYMFCLLKFKNFLRFIFVISNIDLISVII